MTIHELELEINQFFLDSEKEVDEQGNRQKGIYPNAVILTQEHYKDFVKELLHIESDAEFPEGLFIKSICALKVIISSEETMKPRVVRL
jgi:hypothetical protein